MPSAEQMQRFQNMTPEERQKMMEERLKNMTPEEREQAEQMRQRFQNMTPEEREKMRQQRRGGQRRRGAGPGSGGRGEGGGPGSAAVTAERVGSRRRRCGLRLRQPEGRQ